jgi:hypothetical protein
MTQEEPDGFSWNSVVVSFTEIQENISVVVKIGQQ